MQVVISLRQKRVDVLRLSGPFIFGCLILMHDLHANPLQDVGSSVKLITAETVTAENAKEVTTSDTTLESFDNLESVAEEDELCRPVIKVLVRRRENTEVAALRRDVQTNAFDKFAVDIQVGGRIKDQPKILVPVAADRYKVWYGYHSGIRSAVLRTAAEYAKNLPVNDAQPEGRQTDDAAKRVGQETFAAADAAPPVQSKEVPNSGNEELTEGVRAKGYPTRTSWWTVGKKHPEKEGMVIHLSSGPHQKKFDLAWLETLTRDELHSLHSDDHEKKVNWDYASKYVEPPEPEPRVESDLKVEIN